MLSNNSLISTIQKGLITHFNKNYIIELLKKKHQCAKLKLLQFGRSRCLCMGLIKPILPAAFLLGGKTGFRRFQQYVRPTSKSVQSSNQVGLPFAIRCLKKTKKNVKGIFFKIRKIFFMEKTKIKTCEFFFTIKQTDIK